MYGIKKVVSGFPEWVTNDEIIPATVHRTIQEHAKLREMLKGQRYQNSVEFGCGYGRNLPVLKEFSDFVIGIERDRELCTAAMRNVHPRISSIQGIQTLSNSRLDPEYDLILTFTVLQHLNNEECKSVCKEISRVSTPKAKVLIVEETDKNINNGPETWGRSPDIYEEYLGMDLIDMSPRITEHSESGHYMMFVK